MTTPQALTTALDKLKEIGEDNQPYYKVIEDIVEGFEEDNDDGIDDFITEWIKLWPDQQFLDRYIDRVIVSRPDIEKKMKPFIKSFYKKTKIRCKRDQKFKLILDATKRYIDKFESNGEWKYLKTAAYFISKDNISQLANEIMRYHNKPPDIQTPDLNFRM